MKTRAHIRACRQQSKGYEQILVALSAFVAEICVISLNRYYNIILFKHDQSAVAGTSKILSILLSSSKSILY